MYYNQSTTTNNIKCISKIEWKKKEKTANVSWLIPKKLEKEEQRNKEQFEQLESKY